MHSLSSEHAHIFPKINVEIAGKLCILTFIFCGLIGGYAKKIKYRKFLAEVAVLEKRIYNYSIVICQDNRERDGEIINEKFSTRN